MSVQNIEEDDIQFYVIVCNVMPILRNVLVGEGISVKISDFGLSRSLAKENTYYHLTQTKKLPVKWMALECLLYRKFSTYSDGMLMLLSSAFIIYNSCPEFHVEGYVSLPLVMPLLPNNDLNTGLPLYLPYYTLFFGGVKKNQWP